MVKTHESRGFSLIELLVVTAIFVIISGITLASHSRFGGQVVLENIAYDIALSVRHAQLYGIAVRRTSAGSFDVGYGLHFSSPTSYELFFDSLSVTGNGVYDCDAQNPGACELVEATTIVGGHRISDLCVRPVGLPGYDCDVSEIDVLFKRPEPDAYIRKNGEIAPLYEAAQIILESPRGQQKAVIIEHTGQISVQNL
jgi:prepilin-type N-terminal cleavage/methylation domain-containing protein